MKSLRPGPIGDTAAVGIAAFDSVRAMVARVPCGPQAAAARALRLPRQVRLHPLPVARLANPGQPRPAANGGRTIRHHDDRHGDRGPGLYDDDPVARPRKNLNSGGPGPTSSFPVALTVVTVL